MPNPLKALMTLQLELVLHALNMTKQSMEIWLRFQPQPSKVTTPIAGMLPAVITKRQPSPPPSAD
jgi:hypothetical protein